MRQLIKDEYAQRVAPWTGKRIPQMKLQKEVEPTTWAKQMIGSFQHAIDMRKEHSLQRIRNREEKKKIETKGKWFDKIWSCMGYTIIILIVLGIAGPIVVTNFIKSQVQQGSWGEGTWDEQQIINEVDS